MAGKLGVVEWIVITILKFGIFKNKLDMNEDKRGVYLNYLATDNDSYTQL